MFTKSKEEVNFLIQYDKMARKKTFSAQAYFTENLTTKTILPSTPRSLCTQEKKIEAILSNECCEYLDQYLKVFEFNSYISSISALLFISSYHRCGKFRYCLVGFF